MNVVIRADASEILGAGHVMRCLTLADAIKAKNAQVAFICQELPGHLCGLIEANGYPVHRLAPGREDHQSIKSIDWQSDAAKTKAILKSIDGEIEWLVVDHYGLDKKWESEVACCVNQIMVIDDLANRPHQCNILLDQNYFAVEERPTQRYVGLVPEDCETLLGPKYALLRDEFPGAVGKIHQAKTRRVLVSLGGSDSHNVTSRVISALEGVDAETLKVDVVVGQSNPLRDEIEKKCNLLANFNFHCQVSNMATLIANADLVIGAGGITTWERCCLGVPSLVITIADNQVRSTEALAKDGYVIYLGDQAGISTENLQATINCVLNNDALRNYMGRRSQSLVDGQGAARVINTLFSKPISLRAATSEDSEKVFTWRNEPEVRRVSMNPAEIDRDSHELWFQQKLKDPDAAFLIGEAEGEPVGVLRYEMKGELATVSIYLAPDKRGQGFGSKILAAGKQWLQKHQPHVKTIEAQILHQNKSSWSVFQKSGYEEALSVFRYRF
jgi:UDP-2,4-diacetamido-2,4,6-trideoxy-beta-L-altropyranose hydrolase